MRECSGEERYVRECSEEGGRDVRECSGKEGRYGLDFSWEDPKHLYMQRIPPWTKCDSM